MYAKAGKPDAQFAASVRQAILNNLSWIVLAVFASAAAAALPGTAAEAHVAGPEMGPASAAREPFGGALSTAAEPFDGASPAAVAEDEPGGLAASEIEMLESAGLSGAWKPFGTAALAGAIEDEPGADSNAAEPFGGGALGVRVEGPGGGTWSSVRVIEGNGASAKIMLTWTGRGGAIYAHLMAAGTLQ
jgi:hypothetical protein